MGLVSAGLWTTAVVTVPGGFLSVLGQPSAVWFYGQLLPCYPLSFF